MKKIFQGVMVMITVMIFSACGEQKMSDPPGLKGGEHKVITVKATGSNVYFIKTSQGYLMVDSGLFGGEKNVGKLFEKARIDPRTVKLIILTHGHSDHLGGLGDAIKISGAKVLAHAGVADYIKQGQGEEVVPANVKGKILHAITPPVKISKITPDIIMEESYDLTPWGIGGTIIHTPGHSPGSVSIILDSGEALVGDQVRGQSGKLSLGMFFENKKQLLQSLEKVLSYQPEVLYMSHGSYTTSNALAAYMGGLQ